MRKQIRVTFKYDEDSSMESVVITLTGLGAQTVEAFVSDINLDGGLFLNSEKTDWIPARLVYRVSLV